MWGVAYGTVQLKPESQGCVMQICILEHLAWLLVSWPVLAAAIGPAQLTGALSS